MATKPPFPFRWMREPLLQFSLIGAAIFLLYGWLGNSFDKTPEKIVIDAQQIEFLAEGFKRTWQRPPTSAELEGLIQDAVEEEVLYREALAMGLDKDDTMIRRRLRQKMEFLGDEVSAQAEPSESELRDFYKKRYESPRGEDQISFTQIYLNPARNRAVSTRAAQLLEKLNGEGEVPEIKVLGDPLPLPSAFELVAPSDVEKQFGPTFAKSLLAVAPGAWAGPLESAFGLHVVKVGEKRPMEIPEFAEIQGELKNQWHAERRVGNNRELFQGLKDKYQIEIERPTWAIAP